MNVLQVLPALNAGGVERGTLDFARELVERGHQSTVMSAGGTMVAQLEAEGSQHITFPVHRKSLSSLFKVRALRQKLQALDIDVIHVRSRVPAWMTWLALKKVPAEQRPALVSTFHGLYSVSAYSAIMGCGDRVIAISHCVSDYIQANYPKIDHGKISVVHRGVDTRQFNPEFQPSDAWLSSFYQSYPNLQGKPLIVMPGRLSRWKGQNEFIDLIKRLVDKQIDCHGLIVGGAEKNKEAYQQELTNKAATLGLGERVTFLGHRTDMAEIYSISSVVCNMSQHAEPFGRTVIESLAMGVPVVSYDYGGPAESLKESFPEGLVPLDDLEAFAAAVSRCLQQKPDIHLSPQFTLTQQAEATLDIYDSALRENPRFLHKAGID